jgi:purine-cytosine permease-like protein
MLSAIIASFVFARRFSSVKKRGWVIYCVDSAVAIPVLFVMSILIMNWLGVIRALLGAVVFGWVSATAVVLRSD